MHGVGLGHTSLPIGVFWDIENCQVPKYKSAFAVVQRIRDHFFSDHREAEFMCVCDISKENQDIIQELNSAQVNIVHINATSKNAADDKLRQSLRRFADTHPPGSKVLLISSDVNFATDLSDLRHRKHFYIILVHGRQVHESLLACANEHVAFEDLVRDIPVRQPSKTPDGVQELVVRRFPKNLPTEKVKHRLRQLSYNCGGRIVSITKDFALIRFASADAAARAQKRMQGELVFDQKILVTLSASDTQTEFCSRSSPVSTRNYFGGRHSGSSSVEKTRSNFIRRSPRDTSKRFHREESPSSSDSPVDRGNRKASCSPWRSYQDTSEEEDRENGFGPDKVSFRMPRSEIKLSREQLLLQQQKYQERQQQQLNTDQQMTSTSTSVFAKMEVSYVDSFSIGHGKHHRRYSPSPLYRHSLHDIHNNAVNAGGDNLLVANVNSFQPIKVLNRSRAASVSPHSFDGASYPNAVELVVTNLDYNITAKEWKKILFTTFHPHVKVLHVHIKVQPDNTCTGIIKVPTIEEARFAISQFHRKKIGYKRIQVTLKSDDSQTAAANVRAEAIALLSEAKEKRLPLFKFIELFDKRYHKSISVSELYKMKDTIEIREQGGAGRMVYLAPGAMSSSSPQTAAEREDVLEQPVCPLHCREGSAYYAEAMNSSMLPNIRISLKTLSAQVHSLLLLHDGGMPLMSFPACYAAQFTALVPVKEGGVPLEHLVSCIPGVEILVSKLGIKKIQWMENQPPPTTPIPEVPSQCSSPLLSQQLSQICREITDLLKHSPQCRMPVSKFIPAYHHHFGRQCRVADYGYTKLMELFEAIPHVIQVLGTGDRKVLTLCHRAQVRKFTADLLRVLKAQPGKQVELEEFPESYVKVFGKPWDVTQYGVCFIDDLLVEIPATTVMINQEDNKTVIAIPRRDQTPEEMERTKQFALEVVDLLRHNPQCRMAFNKFIPAYHHHFGRQCKVADYGFTKLTDLFEAISHIVEIEEDGEERILCLSDHEMRKVLSEQVSSLLRTRQSACLPLQDLEECYTREFGFGIDLSDFGVGSVKELLGKLKHIVKIEEYGGEEYVVLQRKVELPPLGLHVLQLLMDQCRGGLPLVELCSWYRNTFGEECDVKRIKEELVDYVQVTGDDGSAVIRLTPLQTLACDIRQLLQKHGRILLVHFEKVFHDHFSVDIKPALYGYPNMYTLLQALPHVVSFRGKGSKKFVTLSRTLSPAAGGQCCTDAALGSCERTENHDSDTPSNDSGVNDIQDEDLLAGDAKIPADEDLLCAPIPSAIPSPDLEPTCQSPQDLINFDPVALVDIWDLPEHEKQAQKTPLCRTPTSELLHFAAQRLPSNESTQPPLIDLNGSDAGCRMLQATATGDDPANVSSTSLSPQLVNALRSGWWKPSPSQLRVLGHSPSSNITQDENSSSPNIVQNDVLGHTELAEPDLVQSVVLGTASTVDLPNKDTGMRGEHNGNELNEPVIAASEPQELKMGDSMASELLDESFEPGRPLDSSSMYSGSGSRNSSITESPRKSPARRSRIAAKFSVPIEPN